MKPTPHEDRSAGSAPDALEPAADDAGVMDGVSGVAMAQVILDQPEIVTPIRQSEATIERLAGEN